MFVDSVTEGQFNAVMQRAPSDADLPPDGDLGSITAIIIGIGSMASLLGGGYLWTQHEEHQREMKYFELLEKYQQPPHNLSPAEAAACATGQIPDEGFKFGLNATSAIIVAGSLLGLYVGSQVLLSWFVPGKK